MAVGTVVGSFCVEGFGPRSLGGVRPASVRNRLEDWLKAYAGALLLITHDREFLDSVVGTIVHVDGQKLVAYAGNYSAFERIRAEQLAAQQAAYVKQQRQVAHALEPVEVNADHPGEGAPPEVETVQRFDHGVGTPRVRQEGQVVVGLLLQRVKDLQFIEPALALGPVDLAVTLVLSSIVFAAVEIEKWFLRRASAVTQV